MSGLTRKRITVRTKKGKTFQRSVMVKAEAIGKRTGGKKLNSLNPWQAHHTELVNGPFPLSSGSAGPGSSHSLFAFIVGASKQQRIASLELHRNHSYNDAGGRAAGPHHSAVRQTAGYQAGRYGTRLSAGLEGSGGPSYRSSTYQRQQLKAAFGTRSVFHVPQDPDKWVR